MIRVSQLIDIKHIFKFFSKALINGIEIKLLVKQQLISNLESVKLYPAANMSAAPKTILIIEDNPDIRENTAELLELEGYWVFTASNGDEGLQMAKSLKPDVIICDIVMPGIDGYAVFQQLMNNEETKNIRFVFSTAQSQKNEIDKAFKMGATCYLLKPFDEKQLIACIEG